MGMRYIYTFLFTFLLLNSVVYSQNEPHWTKDTWRASQYPSNTFLTGYSVDIKSDEEKLSAATERLKDLARANLSKNVITEINSVSQSYAQSVEYEENEKLKKIFENTVKAETDAIINGLSVKSFYNEKNNYLYAFAFARRDDVTRYYKAKISNNIQQIESIMQSADVFAGKSEKRNAEIEYEKCIPLFAEITYAQGLLQAVDRNAGDSTGLSMTKSLNLHSELVHKISEVQSTYIFMTCASQLFDEKTAKLEKRLKAVLAEHGCVFTADTIKADFLISVDASAREFNYTFNTYFSYVDANVNIKKAYNFDEVYQDEISQKGGSTKSYIYAAEEAYDNIIDELANKMMNMIK